MSRSTRRHFLRTASAAVAAAPLLLQGCLQPSDGLTGPAAPPDAPDAGSDAFSIDAAGTPDTTGTPDITGAPDTWERFEDVRAEVNADLEVASVWPVVIAEGFQVWLADTACSRHDHMCNVPAGSYADNTPVEVHGGHPMMLHPLEMKALAEGGQIPFHTLPHGSHHHCGTAVRYDHYQQDFDSDNARLEDFFQCTVPAAPPEDAPDNWQGMSYGQCVG